MESKIVRESMLLTAKADTSRDIRLDETGDPSTLGRWVVMIRCIPTARAIWAMRNHGFRVFLC